MTLTERHHIILQHARALGRRPFTSHDIIDRTPRLTRQEIWTTMNQLVNHGFVDVVGRKGRLNVYRLSTAIQPPRTRQPTMTEFDEDPACPPLSNTHARALIDKIVDLLAELEQELS